MNVNVEASRLKTPRLSPLLYDPAAVACNIAIGLCAHSVKSGIVLPQPGKTLQFEEKDANLCPAVAIIIFGCIHRCCGLHRLHTESKMDLLCFVRGPPGSSLCASSTAGLRNRSQHCNRSTRLMQVLRPQGVSANAIWSVSLLSATSTADSSCQSLQGSEHQFQRLKPHHRRIFLILQVRTLLCAPLQPLIGHSMQSCRLASSCFDSCLPTAGVAGITGAVSKTPGKVSVFRPVLEFNVFSGLHSEPGGRCY